MTLEEIMKLIDAGYTKEEINEFKDLQQPEEPEPAKGPTADPEPAKGPTADPEPPAADPEPTHYPDEISKLTEQVKTLTETMQKHFIETAEKKTPVDDGTDVLKNILEKGAIN